MKKTFAFMVALGLFCQLTFRVFAVPETTSAPEKQITAAAAVQTDGMDMVGEVNCFNCMQTVKQERLFCIRKTPALYGAQIRTLPRTIVLGRVKKDCWSLNWKSDIMMQSR